MDRVLEFKDVTKFYPSFTLENISFALSRGEIMGLIGANGAGKTTLIKSLVGLVGISSGHIYMSGKDISATANYKLRLGYVADSCYFPESWCAHHVGAMLRYAYPTWNQQEYLRLLQQFEIPDRKPIKSYSKGMLMRLMIASVLSRDNDLLVLDEPTSGLDPAMHDEFLRLVHHYAAKQNCSVIYSTHVTTDLEKIANSVTFLRHGKLVFSKKMHDLDMEFSVITVPAQSSDMNRFRLLCRGWRIVDGIFEGLMNRAEAPVQASPATLEQIMILYGTNGGAI